MISEADLDLQLSLVKPEGLSDSFQLEYIVANEYTVKQVMCKEERVEKGMESAIWASQSLANSYCFS